MTNILHIVGARPQFMKLAPLYLELSNRSVNQCILHTGQHYDKEMSNVFFDELKLPNPSFNLNINNLSHGAMTGRMIEKIEGVLLENSFSHVIVYGDTNSTLAGAIAAKKIGIKIIHVESGVRNNDPSMPEEINRIITDTLSDILFCNTKLNLDNLKNVELINKKARKIYTGDLMLDCLNLFTPNQKLTVDGGFVLVTCHRAENTTEEKLKIIISALNEISKNYKVIFPVHPRTENMLNKIDVSENIILEKPQGYLSFINLLKNSSYVITDSGGVIREAYMLKKPALFLLKKHVWPELVGENSSINCSVIFDEIIRNFEALISRDFDFNGGVFGDGNARIKMANEILLSE